MATLKESGEAWIAAGQDEYGNMLVDAHDTIERQTEELRQKSLSLREAWAALDRADKERDAALAEVERLKPAPRCNLCGDLISGDPPSGLGKHVFCSTCCAR